MEEGGLLEFFFPLFLPLVAAAAAPEVVKITGIRRKRKRGRTLPEARDKNMGKYRVCHKKTSGTIFILVMLLYYSFPHCFLFKKDKKMFSNVHFPPALF